MNVLLFFFFPKLHGSLEILEVIIEFLGTAGFFVCFLPINSFAQVSPGR